MAATRKLIQDNSETSLFTRDVVLSSRWIANRHLFDDRLTLGPPSRATRAGRRQHISRRGFRVTCIERRFRVIFQVQLDTFGGGLTGEFGGYDQRKVMPAEPPPPLNSAPSRTTRALTGMAPNFGKKSRADQ